jgi:hypothetical protein
VHTATARPPPLFFYPTEYHYSDGHILNSPQTVTAEQITTQFPFIPQMSGVVLIVDWSTLCSTAEHCDFSIIDRVLDYWGKKGRKVVLDVATITYPYRSLPDAKEIVSGTPNWVMRHVRTYDVSHARLLGQKLSDSENDLSAKFPDFRDSRFLAFQIPLIRALARRFDGNPVIAQVRVATGVMGEENPMVGPLAHPIMPGYRELDWVEYCRKVTAAYRKYFTKSELEVDISRFPWIRAVGSDEERSAIDAAIDSLLKDGVFLAFDGWEYADADLMRAEGPSRNGLVFSLRYLHDYKQKGGRVGLEAAATLASPHMATNNTENILKLSDVVQYIHPDRIVLFGDAARKALRNEPADSNYHAKELLDKLGYK